MMAVRSENAQEILFGRWEITSGAVCLMYSKRPNTRGTCEAFGCFGSWLSLTSGCKSGKVLIFYVHVLHFVHGEWAMILFAAGELNFLSGGSCRVFQHFIGNSTSRQS